MGPATAAGTATIRQRHGMQEAGSRNAKTGTAAGLLLALMLSAATLPGAMAGAAESGGPAPTSPAAADPSAATPPPGAAGEAQPANDGARQERDAAQQRFLALMAEDRPGEAVAPGLQVADLTRWLNGPTSTPYSTALANLATAQLRAGDLPGAEANYNAAVAIIERRDGLSSPRLLKPLIGLGNTYMEARQFAAASAAYERALVVSHANEGIYNLDQDPIRDGLSDAYLGEQKLDLANLNQEAEVFARVRKYGAQSPDVAPALEKLGRWYDRTMQPEAARGAYQAAAENLEAAHGIGDPKLVDLLMAIAGTYQVQAQQPLPASCNYQGQGQAPAPPPTINCSPQTLWAMSGATLRQALALEGRQPAADPARRARVLVAMGDQNLILGRRNSAAANYGEAWQELSRSEATAALRDEYFATPVRIYGPDIPTLFPTSAAKSPPPPGSLSPGYAVARYTVDPGGGVTSAEIVESDPPQVADRYVLGALRVSIFRPRYVDGAPVMAEGEAHRHEFRYVRKTVDATPAAPSTSGQPLPEPGAGNGSSGNSSSGNGNSAPLPEPPGPGGE